MSDSNLPQNLRLLCSYGDSVSEICRRIGLNRQQMNKYLSGQTQPSLSTLRRICDFFGVDEGEILMPPREFASLVRLRPPRLGPAQNRFELQLERLVDHGTTSAQLLERHEGYYYVHFSPDPDRDYILRALCRLYRADNRWLSKTIERHGDEEFAVPSPLRFSGVAIEAHNRLIIQEREYGMGRSFWSTMLIASEYAAPTFLPGLVLGIAPEGSHDIVATHVVWQFLGRNPNLRAALRGCGVYASDSSDIADYVRRSWASSATPEQRILTASY
ncbi:helix-turn-helix transcriptional regulator [Defluviimonas sp. WL0050]|uniref:Helix-turn-helix transcriptional regulator n=1 Tax=Albidovulum litorale TaxID=2984134 RepID=A0ABT2ZRK9_9RHOB|nr:helix-turn-helix transcriptional regulator [Defluviimonas sp. WL0050]MCV2873682.1 helix-turn-helix transcriptional regulator [Defluviimonas sp. WL0050]